MIEEDLAQLCRASGIQACFGFAAGISRSCGHDPAFHGERWPSSLLRSHLTWCCRGWGSCLPPPVGAPFCRQNHALHWRTPSLPLSVHSMLLGAQWEEKTKYWAKWEHVIVSVGTVVTTHGKWGCHCTVVEELLVGAVGGMCRLHGRNVPGGMLTEKAAQTWSVSLTASLKHLDPSVSEAGRSLDFMIMSE